MGTNFYARIIPSEERKNKLKKLLIIMMAYVGYKLPMYERELN